MALSGSIQTTVNTHWTLKLSWTATQSTSGNYSNVTASMHWIADSYGAVNSSATKTCNITIGSDSADYSASSMASLNDGQDKIIWTRTVKVDHNSDGTGSFNLDGWFKCEVDISGYVSEVSLTAKTFTLDTIPRASSLTSSANWTAGSDVSFSISRADSSFVHTVDIYVNSVLIKTTGSLSTSGSSGFSTTNNTTIFQQINGGTSQDTKLVLNTYDGSVSSSNLIGTKNYTGTVTAPSSSTLSSYPSTFNIGDPLSFGIARADSDFVHTITLSFGSPVYTASMSSVGTGGTLSYSTSSMYSKIPSANSGTGTFTITTYYNGTSQVQVQGSHSYSFTAKVTNSNPTFPSSNISYADTNTTITAITGNSQYIIQNQSTLTAYVNTGATAYNSATIKSYSISCNGLTGTLTSTGSYALGKITSGSNATLTITVTDSRGNTAVATKTVTVLPYSPPTISAKAVRTDNFQTETTLTISGSLSPITTTVGTTTSNKNASFKTRTYAYKVSTASTYPTSGNGVSTSFTPTYASDGKSYTVPNIVLSTQLDNLSSWNILVTVQDQISSAITYTVNVSTGQPLLFIDSALKSTGINQFPVNANSFEVTGDMWINGVTSRVDDAPMASVFGSDVTQKVYLNFGKASGSNDPAFIMHETSSVTASVNRGVLHLCPTDDNTSDTAGNGDYVAIHGTNDPETIRLYTDGTITTPASITSSSINTTGTGTSSIGGQMTVNGGSGTDQGILLNNGWFRSVGSTGWFNKTYGGGWYMIDTTWVRSYSNKNVYTGGQMKADGGVISNGRNVAETFGSSTIFQAGVVAVPANVTSSNQTFHIGVSSFGTIDGIVCSVQDNYGVSFAMTCECHPYASSPNNTIEFEINSNGGGNYSGVHISYIVFGH